MIRVNLIARQPGDVHTVGRERAAKATLTAIVILAAAAGGIGWRYRSIAAAESQLRSAIDTARSEARAASEALKEVATLETTRGELQHRAALFRALRDRQTAPVHLLDHVSRSLPAAAWLTRLEQDGAEVAIDGQCASMTVLSDFVSNLESAGAFRRPIAIVTSESVSDDTTDSDLVRFSIKATFTMGELGAR